MLTSWQKITSASARRAIKFVVMSHVTNGGNHRVIMLFLLDGASFS